jgi:hypothetical protein
MPTVISVDSNPVWGEHTTGHFPRGKRARRAWLSCGHSVLVGSSLEQPGDVRSRCDYCDGGTPPHRDPSITGA